LPIADWRWRQSFCINTAKIEGMQRVSTVWLYALAVAMTLSSCEVIGGIFKAGMWVGIFLVVIVVVVILWLVRKMRR
jgi:hypothetical protein